MVFAISAHKGSCNYLNTSRLVVFRKFLVVHYNRTIKLVCYAIFLLWVYIILYVHITKMIIGNLLQSVIISECEMVRTPVFTDVVSMVKHFFISAAKRNAKVKISIICMCRRDRKLLFPLKYYVYGEYLQDIYHILPLTQTL